MYLINQLVEFNPDSKSLVNRHTGRAIQLQLPASLCFLYLITHASDIVSQNTLMTIGWGERNNVTTTNTFYQAILTLRNALADVGLPRDTVKTISRRGLRLNENTQVETITLQQSEVSPPPVIEEIPPAKIIPSTPQQTTQIPWFEVLFSVSVV
ncbi:winged helix-turn-helix domain-containing protein, partial [Citrobacter portucalensis]